MDMWHNLTRRVAASKTSLTNHDARQQRRRLHVFKRSTGDRAIISASPQMKLGRYFTREYHNFCLTKKSANKQTEHCIFHECRISVHTLQWRGYLPKTQKTNTGQSLEISGSKD